MARRPELNEKELRQWRPRPDAADRLWKNHGMTGDSVGAELSPFRYIDIYRGDHWESYGWAGINADKRINTKHG